MACCAKPIPVTRDCNNIPGLRRLFYASRCDIDIDSVEYNDEDDEHEVTALTYVAGTVAPGFVEIEFIPYTGGLNSSLTRNAEYQTNYFTTTVTANIPKMNSPHQAFIQRLLQGEWILLAQDNNGYWWILGLDNYVYISDATEIGTGTSQDDFNGYTAVFENVHRDPVYLVEDTVAASLIAGPTPPSGSPVQPTSEQVSKTSKKVVAAI